MINKTEAEIETARLAIEASSLSEKHKLVVETMLDEGGIGAARKTLCTLYGHPPVLTTCFGYQYCARCEEQVGDALAGVSASKDKAIVGHSCEVCDPIIAGLTEQQKLLTALSATTREGEG